MVRTVRLRGHVDKDGKLIIDIPKNIPPGEVEVIVRSKVTAPKGGTPEQALSRDAIQRKLHESGLLSTYSPPRNVPPLSAEEILRLGTLPPDAPSSTQLIDEDRDEY
jgi:hypothetical protein